MGESRNLYKTITETVPEFFFVYNLLQKKITFVSPRFYELADGSEDAPHNYKFRSYIHPEDQLSFEQFFQDLSPENNFTHRIELRTMESLGGMRWVELNIFPVEHEPEVELVEGHFTNIPAIAKQIILLHKGAVTVESEEGQGTVFKIVLPLS